MGKREYEAAALLLIISLAILLGYNVIPAYIGSSNYLYYFKPLFWLALSIYVWYRPRCKYKGRMKLNKLFVLWSIIGGIIYLSVYFTCGFLNGIGASPYARGISGILRNVICFGSVLVMMEWVRNYIINRIKVKYLVLYSIISVIIFTMYRLNLRMFLNLTSWQQAVEFFGEYAIPELMNSILLTYMVYTGGPIPAMSYIMVVSLPIWLSPVLPDLLWITKAFVGIITPAVTMVILRQIYKKQAREIKFRERKQESPRSWIIVSILSIIIIWFAVGVFPIFPTVVLTGSMEPVIYPGDVAVIERSNGKDVKIGDVIQYWTGEIFIIHRIIAVDKKTGKFQTKGDNNSGPDANLVAEEQVRGKLVKVVPKLGMLAIILKSSDKKPEVPVEF